MYMHRRQCGAALGSRSVLLTLCCAKWEPCRGRLPAAGHRRGSHTLGPSPPFDLVAGGDRFEHALQPISCRRSSPRPQPPSLLTGGSCPAGCRALQPPGRRARYRARRPSPGPARGPPTPPAGRRLAARSRPRQGPSRGLFRPAERRALFLPLRGRNRCLERRKKQTG